MTDTNPNDPCRVMAEQIFENILELNCKCIPCITDAIRNHTVMPEMVEFCTNRAKLGVSAGVRTEAEELLAKARGTK